MSAFAYRFVLRCEPKQLMLLYYKICPLLSGSKTFTRLVGCGIKGMMLIFKTEMLIYQSKVDFDESPLLGPVHTYPDTFENASFFIRFGLASTRRRRFRSPKTKLFENALQSGSF